MTTEFKSRRQAALDIERIVERDCLCRSEFSRLFHAISIKSGEIFDINCRSWRCPKHREKWGRKWSMTIGEQLKITPVTLLINLTTAEMVSNEQVVEALRFFIKRFRDYFGPTQYIKVVEYNKRHTQPHFHLLVICEDLKIKLLPKRFTTKWGRKLSFPFSVYTVIEYFWQEALNYACPDKRPTTVVWCQPPSNSAAAASYAVGYITGKSQKNEEPDSSWRGRKLSYSKKFFHIPASQIWQELLEQLFPERDPDDKFFWRLKPIEEQRPDLGDNAQKYVGCQIMHDRKLLSDYYRTFGHYPPEKVDKYTYSEVVFELNEDGQEYFIPELQE